jgi:hypothetical protein
MTKHRSTGEPDEDTTRIETLPVAEHETTPPAYPPPPHQPEGREVRPDESDEVLIELLPPSREGPGERIKVPVKNFGFAITVNDVLYVHVSDHEDGTYQYIPFSAK